MFSPTRPLPALTLLTLCGTALAQRDLASMLPATSWAYAECAGMATGAQTFASAKVVGVLKQVLGAEGWKALEDMVEQRGGRDLQEARGAFQRLGLDNDQVRLLLSGPMALGVGRPTMMGQNPIPSFALVAALGASDQAKATVAAVERFLCERALPIRLAKTTQNIAGVEFAALELPMGQGNLLHALHDGLWYVSNSAGYLGECLNTARNQAPSLAKNASLNRGRGQLPGTRMGGVFLNVQQFGHVVEPFLPYELSRIGAALGVTAAPDLFLGFAHDGKSAHDVLELTLPGPTDGLLKALFRAPATARAARFVKPSTALFASLSLDTETAGTALHRLLEALPAQVAQQAKRGMQRGREVEMARAVAQSFGPELSIALDTPTVTPPFVTFTAFVQVRDQAGAERLIDSLLQHSNLGDRLRKEDAENGKIWSAEFDMQGLRMTPAVALRDGWLVVSNFKNTVKRTLRVGDLNEESLAADARFQAAAKSADGAAFFMTGRMVPLLNSFWGLASLGIKNGVNMLGVEPESVPDAEAMADVLDDIVVTGRVTEQGFALRATQPLGIGTLLPALSSGFDWFLGPAQKGPRKIY